MNSVRHFLNSSFTETLVQRSSQKQHFQSAQPFLETLLGRKLSQKATTVGNARVKGTSLLKYWHVKGTEAGINNKQTNRQSRQADSYEINKQTSKQNLKSGDWFLGCVDVRPIFSAGGKNFLSYHYQKQTSDSGQLYRAPEWFSYEGNMELTV